MFYANHFFKVGADHVCVIAGTDGAIIDRHCIFVEHKASEQTKSKEFYIKAIGNDVILCDEHENHYPSYYVEEWDKELFDSYFDMSEQ